MFPWRKELEVNHWWWADDHWWCSDPPAAVVCPDPQHLGLDDSSLLLYGRAHCIQQEAWTPLIIQDFPVDVTRHTNTHPAIDTQHTHTNNHTHTHTPFKHSESGISEEKNVEDVFTYGQKNICISTTFTGHRVGPGVHTRDWIRPLTSGSRTAPLGPERG